MQSARPVTDDLIASFSTVRPTAEPSSCSRLYIDSSRSSLTGGCLRSP